MEARSRSPRGACELTRAFFRNAGVIAAAEMLARVKGFLIIPLLTHRLGADGYGVWAQVAVLVALLGPLIMLGTDSAAVRYLPGTDRAERARSFAGWIIAIALASMIISGLVALLRHPLAVVAFGAGGEYERYIPLAAATILVTIILNFSRTWFRLENDAVRLSLITVAQAALATVAIVVWYLLNQGLYRLILYSIIADGVVALATIAIVVARVGSVRPDFKVLPRFVRYGVVLLPAGYAIWVLNWADRIFLIHYQTLAAVGIYSLAYSLGYLVIQVAVNPIWTMFPNSIAELWNRGRVVEAQRLFESTAGVVVVLTFPAIAGAAVLGTGLVRLLAPPEFAAAAPVLPIVLGGYLCFMLAAFYETVFGLADRQGLGVVTVAVACAVNVGLNFLLIPPYSYTGAAIATLVAFAVQLLLCLALSRRLGLLRTPIRTPARVAVASAVMVLVLLPLRGFFVTGGGIRLLCGIVLGAAAYGVMCRLFGIVKPGVMSRELRRVLRRTAPATDAS
jgi:O-antigen/teichoic acid export membrane protein